jgi:hypothetical protein
LSVPVILIYQFDGRMFGYKREAPENTKDCIGIDLHNLTVGRGFSDAIRYFLPISSRLPSGEQGNTGFYKPTVYGPKG